ncbi:hypothetical protein L914_02671, partial [Phytophthora nicotianae]
MMITMVALYAASNPIAAETTRDLLSFSNINEERVASKTVTKTNALASSSGSNSGVYKGNSDITSGSGSSSFLATTKPTKAMKAQATKTSATKKKKTFVPADGSSRDASGSEERLSESSVDGSGSKNLLSSSGSGLSELFDMSGLGLDSLSGSELDALFNSLGGSGLGDLFGSFDDVLPYPSESDSGSDGFSSMAKLSTKTTSEESSKATTSGSSGEGSELNDLLLSSSSSESASDSAASSASKPSSTPTNSPDDGEGCPTGFFGHLGSWWRNTFGGGDKCALNNRRLRLTLVALSAAIKSYQGGGVECWAVHRGE